MGFKKIKPSLELLPYVKFFWILDVEQKDLAFVHTILPYPWFELFFNLNKSSNEEARYIGQLSTTINIKYEKPYRAIGVSLKPSVSNCLFQKPATEFTNCSINWSDLDSKSSFHESLLEAKSEEQLISLFENYIIGKLKTYKIDDVSEYISQSILNQPHLGLKNTILSSIGLGRRRIEQRFLASTGVSLGMFIRKSRFGKAVDVLGAENCKNLTSVGLELGYYDQAHFSREFKCFAGITPSAYRKKWQKMSEIERLLQ